MKNNKTKYKKSNLQRVKVSIKFLLFIIILGSILGSFFGFYNSITGYQNNFIDIYKEDFMNKNLSLYLELFIKNFKYLAIIWFLGFIYLGYIFIFILGLAKGFSFGFTTSVLFQVYSFDGIKYAIFNYVPQAFFYIPFFIFISFKSLQNIFNKSNSNNNKEEKYNYYKIFIIIVGFSMFISFLDILFL